MKCVSELLNEGVQKGDFPGAAYAIVYKDGCIDTDFVGYKQLLPEKVLNDGSEIYDCASLTKVISTTSMVMKLIEQNKLSLETKVADILSNFKHKNISIKDLMTHSSGLPADVSKARLLKNREEVLKRIYEFDLIYKTGEKVVYSDVGYILLGLIVEKVSGMRLNEFADITVFKPLGMKDTSYNPDPNRSAPTEYRDDEVYKGWLKGLVHDEKSFAMGGIAGHAGMFSTVGDLSKFVLSFLRNDGTILKPETVEKLFPVQISYTEINGSELIRSLGWNKPTKGGTAGDYADLNDTILHTGFTGCNIWIDRSKGIGFVMLSNAVHPKRDMNNIIKYRNKIANMIYLAKEDLNV